MVFQIYYPELSSNSQKAITLQKQKSLGEKSQGKIIYSSYEVFYLIDKNWAQLIYKEKLISKNKVLRIFSKNKEFIKNYTIFRDLRNKGYIVKSGLKFGTEFRVYKKKGKHAKWLVLPLSKKEKIKIKEFVSMNRVAHSTAKKILIALTDNSSINYYEISWTKP